MSKLVQFSDTFCKLSAYWFNQLNVFASTMLNHCLDVRVLNFLGLFISWIVHILNCLYLLIFITLTATIMFIFICS